MKRQETLRVNRSVYNSDSDEQDPSFLMFNQTQSSQAGKGRGRGSSHNNSTTVKRKKTLKKVKTQLNEFTSPEAIKSTGKTSKGRKIKKKKTISIGELHPSQHLQEQTGDGLLERQQSGAHFRKFDSKSKNELFE